MYGDLDKEIYLSQPEGFIDEQYPGHIRKLNSSLYGLKQSARQWHQCLSDQLKAIGFETAQVDPLLHILKKEGVILSTILVHVDNILLAGTAQSIQAVEKVLHEQFKLTRREEVSHFLSFDITRDCTNKTFTINQASYVHNLVEMNDLENARPVSTPCNAQFTDISKNNDPSMNTIHPYCSLVGALLWLSNGARPDITFAVNRLSSFMTNPTNVHWKASQSVLIYARDMSGYSITIGGGDFMLYRHSNLDWAEQSGVRQSTTVFVFCIGDSPVSWKSRGQPTIALSSTEAEYMALTNSARQAIWWWSIMNELRSIDLSQPTVIHYDNKGAGELALNPCHHSRSKHIDVKHHFICECIKNNCVSLCQIPTVSMLADILTKPLNTIKHRANVKMLFQAQIAGGC